MERFDSAFQDAFHAKLQTYYHKIDMLRVFIIIHVFYLQTKHQLQQPDYFESETYQLACIIPHTQ